MTTETLTKVPKAKTKTEPSYRVVINLGKHDRAVLDFTNKTHAQMECNRIRAAGTYCGAWVVGIELHATE
jgi:hypothetical protein